MDKLHLYQIGSKKATLEEIKVAELEKKLKGKIILIK